MPTLREKIGNPGPLGETRLTPEPIHRSNQRHFEPILYERAKSYACADIRFGWKLLSFSDRGDHVSTELEDMRTGRVEKVTCRFLVGCDGAKGPVRRTLKIKYSGRSSSKRIVLRWQDAVHLRQIGRDRRRREDEERLALLDDKLQWGEPTSSP